MGGPGWDKGPRMVSVGGLGPRHFLELSDLRLLGPLRWCRNEDLGGRSKPLGNSADGSGAGEPGFPRMGGSPGRDSAPPLAPVRVQRGEKPN